MEIKHELSICYPCTHSKKALYVAFENKKITKIIIIIIINETIAELTDDLDWHLYYF